MRKIIIILLFVLTQSLYEYYDYDSKYVTLEEEEAKKNFITDYHLTYVHFIIKHDVENRYVKLYIKGLSNKNFTITPSKNSLISKEGSQTESIAEYKNSEEEFEKMYEIESDNDFELEFEVYYTLSLTGWAIFKRIIIWIFIILVILVILFVIFKVLKEAKIIPETEKEKKEKEERIEKRKKEKTEKEEKAKNLEKFYEKIMENPYRMNYICPFCFIGKDDYHILESDDNSLLVGSEDNFYSDDSEEYLNTFIESLNNGRANKIFAYHDPQSCKHFYHDECKSKFLKHLEEKKLTYTAKSNVKFICYFCKNNVTPQLLTLFCKPEKDEFTRLVTNYSEQRGTDTHSKKYVKNLVNSIYDFVVKSPKINEDIKEKVKERRQLVLKYKKNHFNENDLKFEIPLDEDVEDWENKLEQKKERREQKKEVEMSYKKEYGREIDLRICKNCHHGYCIYCGKDSSSFYRVHCHEKCYNKKYVDSEGYFRCNICNGSSSIEAKCCQICRNSKGPSKCYLCSEPFLN